MNNSKPKYAVPMPKQDDVISRNSMKLYSYLVCIARLAAYPEHTRMFQQRNLCLSRIKAQTGITDKTVKRYLYDLEMHGLVRYKGKYHFEWFNEADFDNPKDYSKAIYENSSQIFRLRNKEEKNGVYLIPRPDPFTPIPDETLRKLNNVFEVTELETKLYILCVTYKDECCYKKKACKPLSFQSIRDTLGFKKDTKTDASIRKALFFLKGVGLIDFTNGYYYNGKGAKIPCFRLEEVYYYIDCKEENFKQIEKEKGGDEIVKRIRKVSQENEKLKEDFEFFVEE